MDQSYSPQTGPTVIPRPEHNISRSNISPNAVKVLYRLHNHGHQAFLVGGGVRDLLLGLEPKDFDVATDAHPEEIRKLFNNCRLIGRRFRLAHIRFGREIIEVATFRASANQVDAEEEDDRTVHDATGRILRDNVYGSIDDDIWRRDFTANALYYNIADFSVWDYTGGVSDVRQRILRLIGDPVTRYREDPVRLLRAVRFAAKLDFAIADESAQPIRELAPLIQDVPAARLYEEALKLFHTGSAGRSFELLLEYDLFEQLFPETAEIIDSSPADLEFIRRGLANTDARVLSDKPVTPMFMFAILLWPAIRARAEDTQEQDGCTELQAIEAASSAVVQDQVGRLSIPRRFSAPMREMLTMQPKFLRRRGPRAARLLNHRRFRAAYDFLLLRAACGQESQELADWWTRIQEESPADQRKRMGLKRQRRRRGPGRGNRRAPVQVEGG